MAEQIGYGEPHNFIRNPLGRLSTKGSTTGLRGTIRLYGIPLEGPCWTIQEHGRPKGNMGIRTHRIIWVPYRTLKDPYTDFHVNYMEKKIIVYVFW